MVLAQKRNSHQNEGAVEGEILEEIEPIMQKFNARNRFTSLQFLLSVPLEFSGLDI